jgi:hypothetical protein
LAVDPVLVGGQGRRADRQKFPTSDASDSQGVVPVRAADWGITTRTMTSNDRSPTTTGVAKVRRHQNAEV